MTKTEWLGPRDPHRWYWPELCYLLLTESACHVSPVVSTEQDRDVLSLLTQLGTSNSILNVCRNHQAISSCECNSIEFRVPLEPIWVYQDVKNIYKHDRIEHINEITKDKRIFYAFDLTISRSRSSNIFYFRNWWWKLVMCAVIFLLIMLFIVSKLY